MLQGINPYPPYYPGRNLKAYTPDPGLISDNVLGAPIDGVKVHNKGAAGLITVDGAESGTAEDIYVLPGEFAPVLVKRITAAAAGVLPVVVW